MHVINFKKRGSGTYENMCTDLWTNSEYLDIFELVKKGLQINNRQIRPKSVFY